MLSLSAVVPTSAGAAQVAEYRARAFSRGTVAPGVWAFVFDNPLGNQAGADGTAVVTINDADVVVGAQ